MNTTISLDYILGSFDYYKSIFTDQDIHSFFYKDMSTRQFIDEVIKHAFLLAAVNMSKIKRPESDLNRAKNSYLFRFSLACVVLILKWILDSNIENRDRSKIHNDIMDMTYISYSSFFDGLLSCDKRELIIAEKVLFILSCL
jgi:hypothetical protein